LESVLSVGKFGFAFCCFVFVLWLYQVYIFLIYL